MPTLVDVAALRSVGLRPGVPLSSLRAVFLPAMRDAASGSGRPPPGLKRVDVVVSTRRALLDDLREEADRLGAVGLVGIEFSEQPLAVRVGQSLPGEAVQLTATAIPVAAATEHRPARTFRTAIDPAGVAVLIRTGWVPVDVVVAGTTQARSTSHRRDDAAAATGSTNREIPGPTDMIQRARAGLRQQLAAAARSLGGDGVLLNDGFDVTWSSTYHLVQVSATGNVIARFGSSRPAGPPSVTIDLRP